MAKPSNLRIEDVGAADARADLNDILISIASLQTTDGAGTGYTGEPTTTYPNMLWYDKATDILKMRTEADDGWIALGTLDQSLDTFAASIALASQAEAEAGANNTKAMTPLRSLQSFNANEQQVGVGQTWQSVTRTSGTTYQNTTGKPIMVSGVCAWQFSDGFQVSTDGSTWLTVQDSSENDFTNPFSVIVPDNIYYRINGTIVFVRELR